MGILFTIMVTTFLIVICMAFIILLLAIAINLIEDTEFGDLLLQKIKNKWEHE